MIVTFLHSYIYFSCTLVISNLVEIQVSWMWPKMRNPFQWPLFQEYSLILGRVLYRQTSNHDSDCSHFCGFLYDSPCMNLLQPKIPNLSFLNLTRLVLHNGVVGWGTVLQAVIGIFHWLNPSGCTVALGSTQSVTELSARGISWGLEVAIMYSWQPFHLHVPIVWEFWELQPHGAVEACLGLYRDTFTRLV